MQRLSLTREEIKEVKPINAFNSGDYGICYRYNEEVLKIFKDEISKFMLKNIRKNLNRNSDIIMYPKKEIHIEHSNFDLDGYTCHIAKGISFSDIIRRVKCGEIDIAFDELLTTYYDNFLQEFEKEEVLVDDVKPSHMFLDDQIYMIDTDLYIDKPIFLSKKKKNELNHIYVNNSFMMFISSFMDGRVKLSNEGNEFNNYLYKILNKIRNVSNGKVNSFKELNNYNFSDDVIERVGIFL